MPARLRLQPKQGEDVSLTAFLDGQEGDHVDAEVEVGERRLPCRLLAWRAPASVVSTRRERLRKQAKKKGRKVSAAQLTLCAWTVYLTNVAAEQLNWQEAWVLARARWQIELLFKLWKSHGGLEASRGRRAARVLCEVYAKLIGQVVQHWLLITCGGPCLVISPVKATRRVRRQVLLIAVFLELVTEVVQILQRLHSRLWQRCKVQKRGRRPSSSELLLAPERVSVPDEQQQQQETELQAA